MQSKRASLVESLVNVALGYFIACAAQAVIFPLFGIFVDTQTHLLIGGLFTVVSIIRSYFIRRLFNWYGHRR